ncbi:MAG: hypothetical protein KME67_16800, partial [Candidatus Thiodiazotropha sp. (ex Codakia orbicularis)]|nr:hypothetical protein [Candidatus Thiodiazotropha sp. (ex Codakia orbicularis)]
GALTVVKVSLATTAIASSSQRRPSGNRKVPRRQPPVPAHLLKRVIDRNRRFSIKSSSRSSGM